MARSPIALEGVLFVAAPAVAAVAAWGAGLAWLAWPFGLAALFCCWFFRDPERVVPEGADLVVSPADGKIIRLERVREERLLKDEALKISIFMNVFNVHVNRVPASGRVLEVLYRPGRFFNASLDKASEENEKNYVLVEDDAGRRYVFCQIAGLIARRIVCRLAPGERVKRGERFGLIRFGSRLDVYLPTDSEPMVRRGEKVRAGSSVLARFAPAGAQGPGEGGGAGERPQP
ncbi:MAG TPA: phosphatidylserine decarboxylase family protein [Deltaproteobacteria bacterium]|nr:phosphatidylserine decarboxylase family protein [Deltaproteobacteria bacterium]